MKYVIPLLFLAACNTPTREFRGLSVYDISEQGSQFDIRVNGNRAEAIRTNREYAPSLRAVAPRAGHAIERGSGCRVKRLKGDAALIHADLECRGGPPDRAVEYLCVGPRRAGGLSSCTPIRDG